MIKYLIIALLLGNCAPQPKKQPSVYIYNLLEQKPREAQKPAEEEPIKQE